MEENNELEKKSIFKKYLLCLKKGWLIILILSTIGLLTGLLISYKTYTKKHEEETYCVLNYRYKTEVSINYNDIISSDNIERCKNLEYSLETGTKFTTYKYVDIKVIKIINNGTYYSIYANKDAFNVREDKTYHAATAKGFLKHLTLLPFITDSELEEYYESDRSNHTIFDTYFDKDFYQNNSLDSANNLIIDEANPEAVRLNNELKLKHYLIITSISFGSMLLISLIFILIFLNKIEIKEKEYDNETIYRTPFHIKFFKDSINVFKDIKSLVFIAILLSLVMICKFIPIPSGFGELGLSFGYLFLAIACMLYGPIPSLAIGLLSDTIGFMIKTTGPFNIGFTIQAMVACFAYAICLHKTYITFTRCLIARVIVNFLCNVIIGTLAFKFMYGWNMDATIDYMLVVSLPKNIVFLLPQTMLLYIVLKALSRPMYHANLLDNRIASTISFF